MADQNIKVKIDLDIAEFNKHAKDLSNAISNVLGKDIDLFNGKLKKTAQQADETAKAFGNTTTAVNKAGNAAKQSNMQWTNLSLIIQDLPYGLRGIQNNLPALAAGMGGVYFAISAVVAVLTAMDMGIISFGNKVKLATDYNKEFASSLAEQKVKLDSLYGIATNVNKSMDDRITAAKKLKEEYPKLLENFSAEDIAAGKAVDAYNKLSEAVIRYAKAEASQTAIKEIVTKQIQNDLKIAEKELQLKDANISADKRQVEIDKKSLIYAAGTINLERVRASTIQDTIDKLKSQNKELGIQLSKYEDIYDVNASFELDTPVKTKGKTAEQIAQERLKAIENANNAEIKAYTETLDERNKKEYDAGLKLAENLQIMRNAGYTDSTTYYAAYRAEMDKIATYYNNKEIEEARKTAEQIAREAEIIDNRQLQNSLDSLKIQSDVAIKIANLSSKTNNADRIRILEEYKSALYDLASTGGYTAEQFDKIDDAITRADAAIAGSQEVIKEYEVTWATTVNDINKMVIDLVNNSIFYLAESLGKALAGEKIDVLSGLGLILADSLMQLGKALIAYAALAGLAIESLKNPLKWKVALAAGIAALAAGAFLKSKLSSKPKEFANGGIISGPTMGLMGEYPGASHNPEVVAPLDKLKSLIDGSGGGTLEARISGNDLLILMNKAGRNNNNTF